MSETSRIACGRWRPTALRLAAILASVGLLLISFPQSWSFRPAAWLALVPWLVAVSRSGYRKAFFLSWLFGVLFFGVGISWIRFVTVPGWLLLSLYLGVYFAIFGLAYKWSGAWGVVLGPFLWVALELARARLLTGFPWFSLGYSQATVLPVIQIADFGSVYAVSFLVILTNLAGAECVLAISGRDRRRIGRAAAATAVAAALLLSAWLYGIWRLGTVAGGKGPRVLIVQGNVPQSLKLAPDNAYDVLLKHAKLTYAAPKEPVDLIIWPETMVMRALNKWEAAQMLLAGIARSRQVPLLIGSPSEVARPDGSIRTYNSAFLISASGEILGRYDKLHLVPFGEYIPLRRVLPFLVLLIPYDAGLSPGDAPVGFRLGGYNFSVLICYEDTIPELVRTVVPSAPGFLVNLTNDGWFLGSAELEQHLDIATFRAIETRMGLVRAANTGVSAAISPTGRIEKILAGGHGRVREVEGTMLATVTVGSGPPTAYMRHGDFFAYSCVVAAAVAIALCRARRRKFP